MRESRFQQVLSGQLLSLAFLSLCVGWMFAASVAQAQSPYYAGPARPASDVPLSYAPLSYAPVGAMPGGLPTAYDPALLANYYNVDPSFVAGATLPYYQMPNHGDYGIDLASYEQNNQQGYQGLSVSAPQQQYLLEPGQNPYRQAQAFGGLGDGPGGPQPQPVPTFSYNAPGGVSLYGSPDPNNGAGGLRFSPVTPPWLSSFETGVYANEDEVLFTLGGTIKLWEGTHSAVAARVVANGATFHHGPSRGGVSVDVWGASRVEFLGVGHLFKAGGLWDQQGGLFRGGFTVSAILFPEMAKCPPTFDLAFGFGGGSDTWRGMYREVADYDAQIRMGFVFFDILRVGGSIQYWQWNNPAFDPNASAAGGYAQLDLGQWMITSDVQATRDAAQGFLNVVWLPGRTHAPLHSRETVNVTSTKWSGKYRSWLTSAPIRDQAMRTGQAPQAGAQAGQGAGFLVRGQFTVTCQFAFITDRNGNGIADGFTPAVFDILGNIVTPEMQPDLIAVNVTVTNGTNILVNNVSAGNSMVTPAAPIPNPAVQTQPLNLGPQALLPINTSLSNTNTNNMQFLVGGLSTGANNTINTVTFDVTANGITQNFTCSLVEGQPLPAPQTVVFTLPPP